MDDDPWQCNITICAELHRRGIKGLKCPTVTEVAELLLEIASEPAAAPPA